FVTLGKPMGNGYPVAALVTRREIVESFAFARRVFSTFGGNPVAARAALAVLDVIEDERIVPRVKTVGELLVERLVELRSRHPSIVDVRAFGLLAGVELNDPERANAVLNAMRAAGVLIGRTGPRDDVLKVRPPLVFGPDHVDVLIEALDTALATSAPSAER
ncbi:MAG TPA: aminotransferase class III-fold pyridoxal phosphate-dependent enzyme, partial [Thermoleophilaceae bacterium]